MLRVRRRLAWLVLAGGLGVSARAGAQYGAGSAPSSPSGAAQGGEPKKKPLPFHDSTFLFDQSATTSTLGIGKSYLSRDPLYEWWFAFKPRYYPYEDARNSLSIRLWLNVVTELTSSDVTTNRREPVTGPTWLWAQYEHTLFSHHGDETKAVIGPRFTIPTDKQSWRAGQVLGVGALAGLEQTIAFDDVDVAHGGIVLDFYLRPTYVFNRTTSLANSDLHRLTQDVGGRPVQSDVLSGTMAVHETMDVILASSTSITKNLAFSLQYWLIPFWVYRPVNTDVCITTGCVTATGQPNATNFRVQTWLVTYLDYAVIPELSLTLGYYNLTNQIGPDGQRRNPLWSPDARFNFTVTAKLDAIYASLNKK